MADRVDRGGIYERLGVRPVINGYAHLTRLGGSLMPPAVLEAMVEAAGAYVDIHDLQRKAGQRVAELTRNEAAYISNGAAGGLFLATLAAVTRGDLRRIARLPDLSGMPNEVVMFCAHRNPYDLAVRQTGIQLVQVGNVLQTFPWELEAVLTDRTAAVFYALKGFLPRGALSLAETIDLAHQAGVPVIVDAADQLPPVENLWRITREFGADLVVFSGGKGLHGPQTSGLIVGRPDLIEACRELGAPHQRIGRPLKVGKEEICGLVTAVECFVTMDHAEQARRAERQVARVLALLADTPGLAARRVFPNIVGQAIPRVEVRVDPTATGIDRDGLLQALQEGDPSIELASAEDDLVFLNPMTLSDGEAELVANRLRELVQPRPASTVAHVGKG